MLARHRTLTLAALASAVVLLAACGRADTLTINPTTPADAELLPAPTLQKFVYKRVLLLPPENKIVLEDVDAKAVKDKQPRFYTAKLEKALLAEGFEVISPEIVARVAKGIKGSGNLSATEKALIMGKETKADAVFTIESISVVGAFNFYHVDKMKTRKVEAGRVKPHKKKKKKDEFFDKETEECLYRLPYYEVRLEAKMIDAGSGDVLWVGSGRQTTIDALQRSYVAKLDKKCKRTEENFVYGDHLDDEESLSRTVTTLLARLLVPLKKAAFAGKPIVRSKKKKKPAPKPEPKKPEPKKKMAVVSSKRASLRAGPGKRNQRIRRVPRKAKVEVLEGMGEWHKVKVQDGTVGWMHESVLIVSD